MATTYEPIATLTFNGTTSTGTFSSIPATFTDLRLVWTGITATAGQNVPVRLNGDTGTNYSRTAIRGSGTAATSYRSTSIDRFFWVSADTTIPVLGIMDIFNYAGSTFKTVLTEEATDLNGSGTIIRQCGLWRDTSAITSITVYGFSGYNLTGTATLYGILKA